MPLPTFILLAYLAVGIQTGISGFLPVNVVMLVAIFVALHAPRTLALLGCCGLGLLQDLFTQQTLGLYTLSYGLIGWLVVTAAAEVYKEHPVTHLVLALFGSLIVLVVIGLQFAISSSARGSFGVLFTTQAFTTLLAPVILWPLTRARPWLGIRPRRKFG